MADGQQPTQIGRYKIVGELGSGGFGKVYRGYDPLVGRPAAIKILTRVSKEVLTRFHNEAMVAGNLRHENIVTVYEYGTHEDFPFLAMEYLEGEDLHQIIASRKPLTILEKCNIMSQVAEGLYCAHRNGVVHRDVKPANIMVLRDGTVKIMDFGIARLTGDRDATRLTQQGYLIGTLLYMAPEQFSGSDFDALCDIFAYGVIFYELITGRHPFEAPDPRILMYKLRFEEPPPIKDFIPEFPDALQQVIAKLVQNDRELRYQSLKDVQFDMEPIRIELQSHRAGELLLQAQELFAKKELEPSQALVHEVLLLEPSNRVGRALWANIQKQINQRTLQPRIESLLSGGEEYLTQRRFAEAVQSFESALRLDRENQHIQDRIEQARRLLEYSTKASRLLVEARRQFEQKNLTAAFRTISEALRQDPQNSEASGFLKEIQSVVERRQAEQRVDEAIRKAEGLLLIPAYDEAIAFLTSLGPDSESPKIQRVLEWARREKLAQERKQRLHNEMSAATDLLRDHKLDEAAHWLEKLHQDFPDDKEVAHLLAYAQKEVAALARSKGVEAVAKEASELADARNFEESLAALERGLKKYPGESTLIRLLGSTMALKGAWERERAVQSAISKCEALRSQERFAEAIEIVEATQQEYSAEPALVDLLERLQKEWTQQRRYASIRKTREQAEALLGQKQPEEAVRLIQQALAQYSAEPALVEVMERAQKEVRALERARAVEAIAKKAVQCAEAHDFDMALRILDKGLETWTDEAVLIRSRGDILASKRAWERQEAIREIDRRARDLQSGERFEEALNLLTKSLLDYPDEDSLIQLRKQVEEGRQVYDRRRAILGIASEARLLLSRDGLDEAATMLNEAMRKYPGESELERLAMQAQDALRARERALAVARTIQQSQGFVATQEFDRATQVLEQCLGRYAGDGELIRELGSVKEAESAWRREQAINTLVARAALLADEKRYDDALKQLEAPGLQSPALTEARKRIEGQRQEHLRREAISQDANEARGLLERGRLEEAIQLLQKAAAKYPGAPEWAPLLTRAQRELAARKRAEAIAKLLRDARSLADQRKFPAALEALSHGLKTFPGDSELESLHTSIEADQAAWKREQAIQRVVAEVEKLAPQGQFEKASGLVAKALEEFKGAPALLGLRRRLAREWELQKRAEAIVQAGAKAKALIATGDLKEALRLLRGVCAQYPEEATLKSLLSQAEITLNERDRREAAVRKARDLITEGRFEEAVSLLEPMVKATPADAEVSSLLARAQEPLALRRRQEAIEKLAKEALALAGDRSFDRAVALVDGGLKNSASEPRLLEIRASILAAKVAWQRAQALQAAIEQARGLGRAKRYADALALIAATLKEYKDDPTLLQLEKEYRLRQDVAQSRRLIEEGRPGEAVGLLEKCAREAAADPEVNALIAKACADIRVADIARQAKEASSLAAAEDFDGALALLEESLRKWPDAIALGELEQATRAQKAAWQRRKAVQTAVAECEELEKRGQLETAIERANKFLEKFQNEPELLKVRERLQGKIADQERRRKRERDLEDLARVERAAVAAASSSEIGALLVQARRIASEYSGDEEVRSAAANLVRHLSDVELAAKNLQLRNFPAAIEICANHLTRFPDHVLFGEFKREAELGLKLAYVEELKRRATAETDLQKRVKILEEGLKRHPDETTFADELRFTRNKLALVHSIVKKARAHEERELWDKALDEWNSLLTIYDQYPGLAAEIERVDRARTKVRSEAVERWANQVEQVLEAGDTGRATSLLRQAQTEFPDTARLLDLARRVKEFAEKKKRARELLAQAQAAFDKGKFEECRTSLRQAFQTDTNAGPRKLVLNKLIEYAHAALQSDWRQAEQLIEEAQTLQPGWTAPDALLRTIADRKKDSVVSECLGRAEQLRKGGDARGALAEVERILQIHPNEARLNKLRDGLAAQIGKERAAVTAELRRIDQGIQAAVVAAELEPFRSRVSAVAAANREDAEIAALAAATLRSLDLRSKQLKRAQITGLIAANRKGLLIGAASAVALFAGSVVATRILRAPEEISVSVTTDVAGVSIAVREKNCVTPNCVFKLAPGTYTLQAAKVGYQSLSRQFSVASKQAPPDLTLALEPLPQLLQINTTFESGRVIVDNRAAGELRDGQFTVSGIAPGEHTVRVTGGGAEFQAEWRSVVGAAPELIRLVTAKDVQAAVVGNVGTSGSIACNCESQDIAVDGVPAGRTPASAGSPVVLKDLKEGARQITLGGRSLVINVAANPVLNVSLSLDRNVGVLAIETGQDKVRVFLNNRLYRRTTEHGTLRIPLDVGPYSIRVEKDGFQASAPQSIALKKGEEQPVRFTLTPVPAFLLISAAPPGTRVKVDNEAIGETDRNGTFRHEITPGPHTIELTRDDYTTVQFTEQFNPGQTVPVARGRVPVAKAPAKGPSSRDPRQAEAQEWARIANSTNPDDFDAFIRSHQDSPHIDQARTRAAELRQQQQASAARQAEQSAWDRVDPNRRDQLMEYLSRYPAGAHAQEARTDIAEIDRKAEALNAQRLRDLEAKHAADEQARRAAEEQTILKALKDLEGAYNSKDLASVRKLWSEAPSMLGGVFKEAKDFKFELQPSGQATISGNSATIVCTRVTNYRAKGDSGPIQRRTEPVKVTLSREASTWVIRSIVGQ